MLKKNFQSSPNKIIKMSMADIEAEDIETLRPGRWISDSIIDCLLNKLMRVSQHIKDSSFGKIDSTILPLAMDSSRRIVLKRYFEKRLNFLVDYILWPIFSKNHWMLCYADVHAKKIQMIDPYHPSRKTIRITEDIKDAVLHTLNIYSIQNRKFLNPKTTWIFDRFNHISEELNFIAQPSNNGQDCGVLVCLYVWSILVGLPLPNLYSDFDACMMKARKKIGGFLFT